MLSAGQEITRIRRAESATGGRHVAWLVHGTFAARWLALLAAAPAAQADPVADFYRGKTVNVLIGVGVGGEYDLQARLVARHIGKHIPGNPTVVPQNMTGAGGLKMTNYLYGSRAARRHQSSA